MSLSYSSCSEAREEPEMAKVDDMLVVMTRAKARQQLEERIQEKEKEITSGTQGKKWVESSFDFIMDF